MFNLKHEMHKLFYDEAIMHLFHSLGRGSILAKTPWKPLPLVYPQGMLASR